MDWVKGYVEESVREFRRQSVVRTRADDVTELFDDNLYERDILIAARTMSSSPLLQQRVNAINDIGHWAWSGGPPVAKFAGNYLVNLASIISDQAMPRIMTKVAIEAIGNICSSSKEARERASMLGLVEIICKLLGDYQDTEHGIIRQNMVYTLLVLVCENRENQREAVDSPKLKESLQRMMKENWKDWPDNEAKRLYNFLGYDRQT